MWRLLRLAAILLVVAAVVFQIYILIKIQPWGLSSGRRRRHELDLEFWVSFTAALPVYLAAGGLEWCARKLRDRPRLKELRAAGFVVTEESHDPGCVRALRYAGFMSHELEEVTLESITLSGRRGRGWAAQVAAQLEVNGRRYSVFAVRCNESWPRLSTRRVGLMDGERYARLIAEEPRWAPSWFRRRVAVTPVGPGPVPPYMNDGTMKLLGRGQRGEQWGIGGGWIAVRRSGALSPEMVKLLSKRCESFSTRAHGLAESPLASAED